MIRAIGRTPVERSTDYEQRRVVDGDAPFGPELGPRSDGTPLLREEEGARPTGDEVAADD